MMHLLNRLVAGFSRPQIVVLAMVATAIMGLLDYLTSWEFSLSIGYMAPVGLAAWYAGKRAGFAIALVSTIFSVLPVFAAGRFHGHAALVIWDGLVNLGFFLINAGLLAALRAHLEREQRLARTDSVTGILNRHAFAEQLQYSLDFALRENQSLTLAYLDLDDFKRVNDEHGHDAGDRLLRVVARTLTQSIRRTDVAARLGGDEFALLLPATDQTGAEQLMVKLRQSLWNAFDSQLTRVTCSIGVVTFTSPAHSGAEALQAADSLMYKVKAAGKNAIAFRSLDPRSSPSAPESEKARRLSSVVGETG